MIQVNPSRRTPVWRFVGLLILSVIAAGCTLPAPGEDDSDTASGPPVVSIVSPASASVYLQGAPVHIVARVDNVSASNVQAQFTVDGAIIATTQSAADSVSSVILGQTWTAEGAGAHTIGVIVTDADGVQSAPASVSVSVVADSVIAVSDVDEDPVDIDPTADTSAPDPATEAPTDTPPPTDPPTDAPPPTEVPPTEPTVPTARFNQGINVRSGPGLNFAPPIGAYAANNSAEILAVNLDGTWYKVRFGSGEGWVFANLTSVEGNINALPREAGPPTPVPTALPPPTAVPPTATPQGAVNLVVTNPFIDPPNPVCGQDFRVGMTIRNDGSIAGSTGLSQIRDIHVGSGSENATSGGGLVAVTLQPGGTHVVEWTFNINTFFNETHRIEYRTDINGEVAESNENDNSIGVDYVLGACP